MGHHNFVMQLSLEILRRGGEASAFAHLFLSCTDRESTQYGRIRISAGVGGTREHQGGGGRGGISQHRTRSII